mgnify:CR=1 FL=1
MYFRFEYFSPLLYNLYLSEIIEAIDQIEEFVTDKTKEKFLNDARTISAILWQLVMIGEAIGQLPTELKNRHNTVPWQAIKDFRNVVVHKYHEIDLDELWDIITTELEPLKKEVQKMRKE